MDPLSIIGGVAATLQLLDGLVRTVHRINRLYTALREVDESVHDLRQDLDTMQFALVVIDQYFQEKTALFGTDAAVDVGQLDGVLTNAVQTFSRLEVIFLDLNKCRRILSQMRAVYKAKQYGPQVAHLRLRITTYISALTLPVILMSRYVVSSTGE
jgi:hypothetical protein